MLPRSNSIVRPRTRPHQIHPVHRVPSLDEGGEKYPGTFHRQHRASDRRCSTLAYRSSPLGSRNTRGVQPLAEMGFTLPHRSSQNSGIESP
jgi:hypothetical protein